MTRRLQTQAANPAAAAEPEYDALVAMYEHEALKLMMRCLYRQFLKEENADAVRTAATLLKSLPPARRGNEWIEALEAVDRDFPDEDPELYDEIQRDFASLTPEEMDAEILAGMGVVAEVEEAAVAEVGAGEAADDFRPQRESRRHPSAGRDPDSRAGADQSGA